jgi:hypothetical protein
VIFQSRWKFWMLAGFGALLVFGRAEAAEYSAMAPVSAYLMDREAEIALARTAAPVSISGDADVLVLGRSGYETAVKGKNGFVCFVERSWTAPFEDPEYWNPKERSPNCFNPPAVRTELPRIVKTTEWALSGLTKQQIEDRTKAAVANGSFKPPEPGAFSFMLSKSGYLSDAVGGPWYPHVMFFIPYGQAANWAAGEKGSPVIGQDGVPFESTLLYIPVRRWSDGSPALPTAPPSH